MVVPDKDIPYSPIFFDSAIPDKNHGVGLVQLAGIGAPLSACHVKPLLTLHRTVLQSCVAEHLLFQIESTESNQMNRIIESFF